MRVEEQLVWLRFYLAAVVLNLAAEGRRLIKTQRDEGSGTGGDHLSGTDWGSSEYLQIEEELKKEANLSAAQVKEILNWLTGQVAQQTDLCRKLRDNSNEFDGRHCPLTAGFAERKGGFARRVVCDFFQPLFESLFCRKMRHKMGEYYTPLWMARQTLSDLDYGSVGREDLLDPCCGSGSFLLASLEVLWNRYIEDLSSADVGGDSDSSAVDCLEKLTGFDVNPLAVLLCRANLFFNLLLFNCTDCNNQLTKWTGESLWKCLRERIQCQDFLLDFSAKSEAGGAGRPSFSVVASNPPWIAWDNLSEDYRRQTDLQWRRFGLFSLKGAAARHGGAKKDLAALFFYAAADCLKPEGRVGMVLPRSLFQSVAAEGFRRWSLPENRGLKVRLIRDYSRVNIFDTRAAQAAVLIAHADGSTRYPIPFFVYSEKSDVLRTDRKTAEFPERLELQTFQARLSQAQKPLSGWTIEPKSALSLATEPETSRPNAESACFHAYQARLGANTGGANGVFWLEVVEVLEHGLVRVKNRPEKSKKPVAERETVIESDLLYPLACWKDVQRWRCADRGMAILVAQNPQTRTGWDRSTMEQKYPKTLEYLLSFQNLLERRAAQIRYQEKSEFYSMYNIGVYTLSSWKTVWRRMDSRIRAVAVGPRTLVDLFPRPVFPQETCCFVPADSEQEACYLAGVLNSPQAEKLVQANSAPGSKSFGSPRILSIVPLERFDSQNSVHCAIAKTAKEIQNLGEESQDLERELIEWTRNYFENVGFGSVTG